MEQEQPPSRRVLAGAPPPYPVCLRPRPSLGLGSLDGDVCCTRPPASLLSRARYKIIYTALSCEQLLSPKHVVEVGPEILKHFRNQALVTFT